MALLKPNPCRQKLNLVEGRKELSASSELSTQEQAGSKYTLAVERSSCFKFNIAAFTQMAHSPDLPLDVIRLLMEAAAWSDHSIAYNLTLVSKAVHQW